MSNGIKKRLIICSDGTWQTLDTPYPTNVVKIAQAIKPIAADGTLQILFYDSGIGTAPGQMLSGGALGRGIDEKILNAYRFLCLNYCQENDDEIYLFGFSRGAYTVRSLAGLVSHCGLLPRQRIRDSKAAYELYRNRDINQRDDPRAVEFRMEHEAQTVNITLLGCWDTVGALGIPDLSKLLHLHLPEVFDRFDFGSFDDKQYQFHNTTLNKVVQHALHAVAIDEHREVFDVTPMQHNLEVPEQKLQQVWFPGEHGCVGGGTPGHRGLSDGTLEWMIEQIRAWDLGLEIDEARVQYSTKEEEPQKFGIHPEPDTPFLQGSALEFGFNGLNLRTVDNFAALHESVKIRWRDRQDYHPTNLAELKPELDKWAVDNSKFAVSSIQK